MAMVAWYTVAVLAGAALGAAVESPLKVQSVPAPGTGEAIYWRAFETGTPAGALLVVPEAETPPKPGRNGLKSYWSVRHPGWTPALLNAVGQPDDVTFDPGRNEVCDIYLGLRAVDPRMTLGIRLDNEPDYWPITAPAATSTHHFDFEFHWRAAVPMAGRKVVVHSYGQPLYLQYLKFVPQVTTQQTVRVPEQRISVLNVPGRHFAFPGVAELADGTLLVVCREGDAHVCPRGRIVMTRSTDGGATWSARETIYDSPSDERDPAILTMPDGKVVVSYNTWDSWRADAALCARYPAETARMAKDGWGKYSGSWLIISEDGGRTWSPPRRSPTFSPHGPVPGPGGALYWVGLEHREGNVVVVIYRTADLGRTWDRYSEVSYSRDLSGADRWEAWDEPNLIFLPDGRAICTIRVDLDGWVRQSYSTDGGQHWSWPKKLAVWGYPQQLCRLADGRLLMAYGRRRAPLGIRACLSADGGRTWGVGHEIAFRNDCATIDLGYPYTIQLRDGRVFTVYYANSGRDCYLEAVAYRP